MSLLLFITTAVSFYFFSTPVLLFVYSGIILLGYITLNVSDLLLLIILALLLLVIKPEN